MHTPLRGSTYITSARETAKAPHRRGIVATLLGAIALFAIMFTAFPLFSSGPNAAVHEASAAKFAILCSGDIGGGMDTADNWNAVLTSAPHSDAKSRDFTMQEALGKGVHFVTYHGEGESDNFFIGDAPEREKGYNDTGNFGDQSDRLNGVKTFSNCFAGAGQNMVANAIMMTSGAVVALVQTVMRFAFDPSIICTDPENPSGACFNLLKVLGGSGKGEGIIGALTSSIYLPLIIMLAAVIAIWVVWNGIARQRVRETFFGIIWVVASTVAGLALLMNPDILARAPMAVTNTVGSCIIGAFSGNSCFDGSSTGSEIDIEGGSTSADICYSDVTGLAADEKMSMAVNSMGCQIWKAFVLNPYSQASFGASFDDLDTKDSKNETTIGILDDAGLDADEFCVSLNSSGSYEDYMGKRLELDEGGREVCNVAAYQMYLHVNAVSTSDSHDDSDRPGASAMNDDWSKVIVFTAHDNGAWTYWSPSMTSGALHIGLAGMSLFSAVLGGIVIVVVSIFALMYYLASLLLIAFAPIFLLVGVHPGKGRRILAGWGGQVISAVLKYLASAVFLIVTVAFYSGILSEITNIMLAVLFVIVITVALLMYRKEIVNMMGMVDLGGEKLSSGFSDMLTNKAKGVGRVGSAVAGGALGGIASQGVPLSAKDALNPMAHMRAMGKVAKAGTIGASEGAGRQLKRGNGILANAARTRERGLADNKQDMRQEAKIAETEATRLDDQADATGARVRGGVRAIEEHDARTESAATHVAEASELRETHADISNQVLVSMQVTDPDFAEAQALTNQLKDLNLNVKVADAAGDKEAADNYRAMATDTRSRISDLNANNDFAATRREYNARVKDLMNDYEVTDNWSQADEERYANDASYLAGSSALREKLESSLHENIDNLAALQAQSEEKRKVADSLSSTAVALRPGQGKTIKAVDKLRERALNEAKQGVGEDGESLKDVSRADQLRESHHEKYKPNSTEQEIPDLDPYVPAPPENKRGGDRDRDRRPDDRDRGGPDNHGGGGGGDRNRGGDGPNGGGNDRGPDHGGNDRGGPDWDGNDWNGDRGGPDRPDDGPDGPDDREA